MPKWYCGIIWKKVKNASNKGHNLQKMLLTYLEKCEIMGTVVFKNAIEMNKKNKPNIPWWQPGLALFARLSSWIAVPVILAVVIGKWLDGIFHSAPWLFLLTVAIAFAVSMVMIIRIGLKEMDKK